jgi:hypothetical protein
MNKLTKLAAKAALAGSIAIGALAATAPAANAGVSVGIGIGGPVYGHNFCYYHPHRCGYRPAGYVAGPSIGVFYAGHGWWDGHRYWGHRYWGHGGWRFR